MTRQLLLILALAVAGNSCANADGNIDDGRWQLSRNILVKGGTKNSRGLSLYTLGEHSLGAAFRCEKQKLKTYLALKEVNMGEMITWMTRRPRRWPVRVAIGGEERDEEWVSIHGGRVYLVVKPESAHKIFNLAEHGTTITVDPKGAKPVELTLPSDRNGKFDEFRERCGFLDRSIMAALQ